MKKSLFLILLMFVYVYSNTTNNVSIQLKWKHQFQFAGFYMAQEKGFYKDVGINLDIKEYQGGVIVDDVLENKFTFGIDDSQLLYHRVNGKDIVGLFVTFQDSPLAFMTTKKIKTLKDLNNLTIHFSKNALHNISMQAMLKSNGVEIKTVDLPNKVQEILNGNVEAISGYLSNELFQLKQHNIEYNIYHPRDYGLNFYGDILFTSEQTAKDNPELVQKFVEATRKGWEYVFENVDESINVILDKYNTQNKSKEWLLYEYEVLKEYSGDGENFGKLEENKINEIAKIISLLIPNKYNTKKLDTFIWDSDKELLHYYKDTYFKHNKTFTVCTNHDFMPIDGVDDGKVTGIAGDVLNIISSHLDISFVPLDVKSRDDLRQKALSGQCDLVSMSSKLGGYDEMTHSHMFLKGHFAVISKLNIPFIGNSDKIIDNKKYITRYKSYASYLKLIYPNINIIFNENIEEALQMVDDEEVDGYIVDYITADRVIQDFGYGTYKISGFLATKNPIEGGFTVSNSKPQLLNAINIILNNMNQYEFENIKDKWRIPRYTQNIDYALIKKIIFSFLAVLLLISIFALILKANNKKLKQQVAFEIEKNTQQQAIMFQQARFAEMGQMISMIAHQWRQPLNHISLLVNNFFLKYKKEQLTSDAVDDVKAQFQKQILYMSKTIDDFQNFFKPHKEKEYFYINDAIHDSCILLKDLFDSHNIKINFNLDKNIKYFGYKNELGQVFLNILNNSKDAFVESNIENKLITISSKKTKTNIIINIQDTAGGIDESIIHHIFDPYFSTKKAKNGTGLGLYIGQIIIKQYFNGKIESKNTNKGVLFKIILPVFEE
jgi:signal transduction histidine kinase/ABC-type nitrate/sulfonate/bicarbonate transport system substrate-binding protein